MTLCDLILLLLLARARDLPVSGTRDRDLIASSQHCLWDLLASAGHLLLLMIADSDC